MYYGTSMAYRSKIDDDRFFATSDQAKSHDLHRIREFFGHDVIMDLAAAEHDDAIVNLFKFATEWASEERMKVRPKAEPFPEGFVERIKEAEEAHNG